MLEKLVIDAQLFKQDEKEDKSRKNCFSFVLWALGIDAEEKTFRLSKEKMRNLFQVVESMDQANAIGVRDLSEDGEYEHIALVDPSDNNFVIHRFNSGHPLTRISSEEFLHQRDGLRSKYEYDYLRLKNKRPWWLSILRK